MLPGVFQLGLVLQAIRDASGRRLHVRAIGRARWRSPVKPGDTIDIDWTGPGEEGTVAFTIRRGGELVSEGSLRLDEEP